MSFGGVLQLKAGKKKSKRIGNSREKSEAIGNIGIHHHHPIGIKEEQEAIGIKDWGNEEEEERTPPLVDSSSDEEDYRELSKKFPDLRVKSFGTLGLRISEPQG